MKVKPEITVQIGKRTNYQMRNTRSKNMYATNPHAISGLRRPISLNGTPTNKSPRKLFFPEVGNKQRGTPSTLKLLSPKSKYNTRAPRRPAPSPESMVRSKEESKITKNYMNNGIDRKASVIEQINGKPLMSFETPRIGKSFKIPMTRNLMYSIYALKQFMGGIILPTKSKNIQRQKLIVGEKEKRLMVIDLDQTLIFQLRGNRTELKLQESTSQHWLSTKMRKEREELVQGTIKDESYVCRPYLQKFLKNMSRFYDICIFSQLDRKFIERVINEIDPERIYISDYLSRGNMTPIDLQKGGRVKKVKSLEGIEGARKEDSVIIDPNIHLWPMDLDNLLPAEPYWGDTKDAFLPSISQFLITLARSHDIQLQIRHKCAEIIQQKKLQATYLC